MRSHVVDSHLLLSLHLIGLIHAVDSCFVAVCDIAEHSEEGEERRDRVRVLRGHEQGRRNHVRSRRRGLTVRSISSCGAILQQRLLLAPFQIGQVVQQGFKQQEHGRDLETVVGQGRHADGAEATEV